MSKPKVEQRGRASDDDALRLSVAFYCIMEPERRAEVLALTERLAKQSGRVNGLTHDPDLDQPNESPASIRTTPQSPL